MSASQPQQDTPTVEMCPTLKAVTVFGDRAQLTYTADVSLAAGTHLVSLRGEKGWESALQSTLRVHVGEAARRSVTLRGVRFRTNVRADDVRERVRALERARDEAQTGLDDITDRRAADDAVEAALRQIEEKFCVMGERGGGAAEGSGKAGAEPIAEFLLKPAAWSGLTRFLSRRRLQVGESRLQLAEEAKELEEKKMKIVRDLNDLRAGRAYRRHEMSVEVILSVPEPVENMELFVSFVAMGAAWKPLYDIRVDLKQSTMDVAYHAQVQQSTSMDWNKVQMKLSTATPHFNSHPPELGEWNISLNPPVMFRPCLRSAKCRTRMLTPGVECDSVSPPLAAAPVEQAVVSSSSTSDTFQIIGLTTVRSDNKPVKVTIGTHTFPVKMMYHAVPKCSPWTYIIAKAKNASPYVFLPGKANVFSNNTFVSNSHLDLVPVGSEFTMSLGTDDAVSVTRKRVKHRSSSLYTMMRHPQQLFEYVYEFTVKASLAVESTLVVRDQCPVSSHNDIVVKVTEPSKKALASGTTAEGNGCSMDSVGLMEWELQLPPGVFKQVFHLAFQVEFPQQMAVCGIDL